MLQSVKALFLKPGTLLAVYIVAAIVISVQLIFLGSHPFVILHNGPAPQNIINKPEIINQFVGQRLTDYNNYLIFKCSWFHLLHGTNLYGVYPAEYWDFYKYSPSFALFMAPIAYLPDVIGLSVWNIINGLTVFFAIRMLPFNSKVQCLVLWFVLNDLMCGFSNTQSNGLMCGLIIAAFACMQNGKAIWATLWLVFATYIKVYGAIGFCLFLFYPGKLKFIFYAALWTIVLAALPLIVTPFNTLVWQYHNWISLLQADASMSVGLSVTGWLSKWFGINNVQSYVTITGAVLFLITLSRFRLYSNEVYRLLVLASMLIWVIIFNHKAESPTFVIAVAGVAIWYFAMPKAMWRMAVIWFVFIFTCLATTDIFPPFVRTHFIYPYNIKAFPCILAWCVVFAELMLLKPIQSVPKERLSERIAVIPINLQ